MPQARPALWWNAVASLSFLLHLVSRSLSPWDPRLVGCPAAPLLLHSWPPMGVRGGSPVSDDLCDLHCYGVCVCVCVLISFSVCVRLWDLMGYN